MYIKFRFCKKKIEDEKKEKMRGENGVYETIKLLIIHFSLKFVVLRICFLEDRWIVDSQFQLIDKCFEEQRTKKITEVLIELVSFD